MLVQSGDWELSGDFYGWAVADPDTECPDCGWVPDNPPSFLEDLLDLISGHVAVCPGADLS